MDAAIYDIVDNGPPQIIWDSIAPTIEENKTNTTDDDVVIICNIDSEEDEAEQHNTQNNSTRNKMSKLFEREVCKDIMPNPEYHKHLWNLNYGQWRIVMSNRSWHKTYVRKMWDGKFHKGYKWYLGGPGGTGKSHVIQLIRWDVI